MKGNLITYLVLSLTINIFVINGVQAQDAKASQANTVVNKKKGYVTILEVWQKRLHLTPSQMDVLLPAFNTYQSKALALKENMDNPNIKSDSEELLMEFEDTLEAQLNQKQLETFTRYRRTKKNSKQHR